MALASYVSQAYGLQHISSNRSAFITSLNVLMVPFLGLMFGGRLSWLVLSRCSNKHEPRYLAATQIAVMAAAAIAWMLFQSIHATEPATLAARVQPHFVTLLYLGVVATAGMLFLQAVAQRNVSADKAAVIFAMEPVFAALFGWLWLNELLGWRGLAGGALVIAGLIISEIRPASSSHSI